MPKPPETIAEMIDWLDRKLLELPHVQMTDVDLVTGAMCVLMSNGKRFELAVTESPAGG